MHLYSANGTSYDVYRLIELSASLPVEIVALENPLVIQSLREQCWDDAEGNRLSPGDLLQEILEHGFEGVRPARAEHGRRVREADTQYPLLAAAEGIVDGMHRLVRTHLERQSHIRIRRFPQLPAEAIIIESGNA